MPEKCKALFMKCSCDICKKFEHIEECPKFGDHLIGEILERRQEIKLFQMWLRSWKQGKSLSGKKLRMLA
jgi:hypothetical protein